MKYLVLFLRVTHVKNEIVDFSPEVHCDEFEEENVACVEMYTSEKFEKDPI